MTVYAMFEGRYYDPHGRHDPEHDAEWRDAFTKGQLFRDGEEMSPKEVKHWRAQYFQTYARRNSAMFDPTSAGPVRAYIPALWNHGTIPMLGGPPKAGKSSLVLDLSASLIVPDRRFLNRFDPVEVTEAEAVRDVWLLNAENPPGEVHEVLLSLGLEFDSQTFDAPFYYHPDTNRVLFVDHLEALGGADVFDLSDKDARDFWEYRIHALLEHRPPLTVIADGVTAMVNAKTTRYGKWYAGFRKLLRTLDVPNGLAIGHSGMKTGHLMNGVESIAGPDGLWMYNASEPDKRPNAARTFQVTPRLLGPTVPLTKVAWKEGRLTLQDSPVDTASEGPAAPSGADDDEARAERIRGLLGQAGAAGALTTDLTGRGPDGLENRRVLEAMKDAGEVRGEPFQHGRSRGVRWWPVRPPA